MVNQPHVLGAFSCLKLGSSISSLSRESGGCPHTRPTLDSHDTENHGVIIKGELILTMAGKEQRFGVGDWYTVPKGAEHAVRFEVETDEVEFWFYD